MPAPATHTKVAGAWKRIKLIHVKVSGTWKVVTFAYTKVAGLWKKVYAGRIPVTLTLSSNQVNFDAYVAAGSPNDIIPRDVVVTINNGVSVLSNVTSTPSLKTGGPWPAGSTFTIVNNGSIIARGGNGGQGGSYSDGYTGYAGGNAIEFHNSLSSVTIDNTNGNIFGGGGGGGGGGAVKYYWNNSYWTGGGGGGGGGAGLNTSTGGAAGSSNAGDPPTAGAGGTTTGGAGGIGAYYFYEYTGEGAYTDEWQAGAGGAGGAYATTGSTGVNATFNATFAFPTVYNGAAGGGPGKAINLNGVGISWSGGNNPTQVKGAVT